MNRIPVATHCPFCGEPFKGVPDIFLIGGRVLISGDDRVVSLGVVEGAVVREVAQPGGPHPLEKIADTVYATEPGKGPENVATIIRLLNHIPKKLPYLKLRMFAMRNVTGVPGFLFGRMK